MMNIEITASNVILTSPYHPDLPAAAKALGGRWDRARRAWIFDRRDAEEVRQLCRSIYGTDDLQPQKLVTLRLEIAARAALGGELWACGRLIAKRGGRDLPVRLGEGVLLRAGQFGAWGGSARHPEIMGSTATDVSLEIRDVPEALAAEAIANQQSATCHYSLVDEAPIKISNPLEAVPTADLVDELIRRGVLTTI